MSVRFSPTPKPNRRGLCCPSINDLVWHGYLPDVAPGQLYGFRVYGPYEPAKGHRFNSNKILLDPYANASAAICAGPIRCSATAWGIRRPICRSIKRDNARYAPLAKVIDTAFTWGDDRPPRTPWQKTLIYELHVKGFTKLHPEVPEPFRGTLRRAWVPSRCSDICSNWASRPSNCCRCIII